MKLSQVLSLMTLALVVGAILMYAFIPKGNEDKRLLEAEKKNHLRKIDSISSVQEFLVRRNALWTRIHAQDRDSLLMARKQANTWRNEYKKIINAPVIRYSEPALDSAVDALISARLHKTP